MSKNNLSSTVPARDKPDPEVRHHADDGFGDPDPDGSLFNPSETDFFPDSATETAPDNTPVFHPDLVVYDCEHCSELLDCYRLIDSLVHEILYLEEDVVNWRHALVRYLKSPTAEYLQDEIFDGLAKRFYDNDTYQRYMNLYHYKKDPMESKKHSNKLQRLANGTDKDSIHL